MYTDNMKMVKAKAEHELAEVAKDGWTAATAETAANLTTIIKNICKLEEMDLMAHASAHGYMGGNSGAGVWGAYGEYGGNPMMRQSWGRDSYAGTGNSYGDYTGDTSGRQHWVRGHYSRSSAEEMLEEQMRNATDPAEREKLRNALNAMRS